MNIFDLLTLLLCYLAAGELIAARMDCHRGGELSRIYLSHDFTALGAMTVWLIWPVMLTLLYTEAEIARTLREIPHTKPHTTARSRRPRRLMRPVSHQLRFFTRPRRITS